MSKEPERTVTRETVLNLACYAGLNLPEERVDLIQTEVQRFLEAIRSFDDLPLDDVQPASTYRLFWEKKL